MRFYLVLGAALCVACATILTSRSVQASPILIHIDDHDFSILTDKVQGTYAYNGTAADTLTVSLATTPADAAANNDVQTYAYAGDLLSDLAGLGVGRFPVWGKKGGTSYTYGADLGLSFSFDQAESPYVSGTDTLLSLVGHSGDLTIKGIVALAPPSATTPEMTLLQIHFSDLSLVARPGNTVAKVTGEGTVQKLFDSTLSAGGLSGLVSFDFETANPLFTSIDYTPGTATEAPGLPGRISGETGVVPEPASLGLLGLGVMGLLARRRR